MCSHLPGLNSNLTMTDGVLLASAACVAAFACSLSADVFRSLAEKACNPHSGDIDFAAAALAARREVVLLLEVLRDAGAIIQPQMWHRATNHYLETSIAPPSGPFISAEDLAAAEAAIRAAL